MNQLGINWFDAVFLALIAAGIAVGRKRGMSTELLDLIQWALIVVVCSFTYAPLGKELSQFTGFSPVTSSILAYLLVAGGIFGLFLALKRYVGRKLFGSDVFGTTEYYLGMVAGAVRFFLILIFALALFNAPQTSDAELAKRIAAQNESLGAIYFPPLGSIQRSVFRDSLSGRLINEQLSAQLIQVNSAAGNSRENIWRRRENEVNEIVGTGRR
ncbi:MAG: CvpA family protein [Verrucomicrobia bacterium]|nr:CvpA family protein [Verrucomicrobiota bacterium]